MALHALQIVKEMLDREVRRLHHLGDRMVRHHVAKIKYARIVMGGGFCSETAKKVGLPFDVDLPYVRGSQGEHQLAARRYLDSCGPALADTDEPSWVTLPEYDLGKHGEYGRMAAKLALLRDVLLEVHAGRSCVCFF